MKASDRARRSASRVTAARAGGREVPAALRQAAERNRAASSGMAVRSSERGAARPAAASWRQARASVAAPRRFGLRLRRIHAAADVAARLGADRAGALVGRIVDPGLVASGEPIADLGPPEAEQRSKQEDAAPLRPGGRRRPFARLRRGGSPRPHQPRLQDVVGGVAHQDDAGARGAGGVGQQPMAGGAGGGGKPGGGLLIRPGQGLERQAEPVCRSRAGLGPGRARRLQAVVDGQHEQVAPRHLRPVGGRQQEGQGIAAARNGDGHRAPALRQQPAVEDRRDGP